MDGEFPRYNNVVHNDLDPFMTSEDSHLLQQDHGDETYGLLGATANVGMIDNTNVVAGNQGNNNVETYSEQRMETRRANYHRLRREQIQQLEAYNTYSINVSYLSKMMCTNLFSLMSYVVSSGNPLIQMRNSGRPLVRGLAWVPNRSSSGSKTIAPTVR